jgi:hypothetical protein
MHPTYFGSSIENTLDHLGDLKMVYSLHYLQNIGTLFLERGVM